MQVFEEKCDKLYAGRYAQNLGEINANRNLIVLLLHWLCWISVINLSDSNYRKRHLHLRNNKGWGNHQSNTDSTVWSQNCTVP